MNVQLRRTVTDCTTHRRYNIYEREDGKFFVLVTPTNPYRATNENVHEFVVDTFGDALELTR